MQYKDAKGINDAARQAEADQPKPGAFRFQICHWVLTARYGCQTVCFKASARSTVVDICLCLPSDRTWHNVNDPKVNYSGDLGEGKVGHESRLEPCWNMLVINWTTRFSAIQGWQMFQWCSLPIRSRGPFGLVCHWALTVRHRYQTVHWKASAQSRGWSSWNFSQPPTR